MIYYVKNTTQKHKKSFDKPKLTVKAVFEYLLITAFVKAEKYFLNIR